MSKTKRKAKSSSSRITKSLGGCLVIIVAIVAILTQTPKPAAINPTMTSRPDVRPTATEGQAIADVPTVVNRSGFVTVTPAPGTVYPTATITDTLIPTATATDAPTETPALQITPVSNNLYDVRSTANARSCPDSKCALIGKFQSGDIISVSGIVSGENYKNNPLWIQAIYHSGQTVYVHSSLVTPHVENAQPVQPTSAANAPVSPVVQPVPPQQSFICPKNCTDAVAMGLSAEQAATCPGLDRNHNGVACYGS